MFLSRARCLFRSFSLGLSLLAVVGSALAVPPVVTTQPGVVNATSGQNAVFTVVATGSGAQTYQWRHLGTSITGANTPTLTLANVKMADAGFYDVVVTDGAESAVSQAGRLVVAPVGGYSNTLRLDTSFAPLFENAYGWVQGVAVGPASEVYVGGVFSLIAGQRRSGVAKFNAALEVDAAFAPVFDGSVYAVLVQPDGKVVAGGAFTKVNGIACNQIVRLNSDGSVDGSFLPGAGFGGGTVWALARQSDGKILVGGNFYSVGGTWRSNIARLNSDGSLDATFGASSGPNSAVYTLLLQSDGKVLIGGWFTSVGGTARGYIARLNFDGSLDATFAAGSGFNSGVMSLALQADAKVVAGGGFTTFNGTTCNRIARIDSSGALDATLVTGTGFNSDVRAVAVLSDGRIAASGYFGTYNGATQSFLSVLTATGAIDGSFAPASRPSGASLALVAQPGGKFVAGGGFSALGSTACSGLAKLSATGVLESYAAAGFRQLGEVRTAVPVSGGKWVVAGSFSLVNGTARGSIARLNADGSLDTAFAATGGFNSTVTTLAVQGDGRLVVGGLFTAFNAASRTYVARLNADGTLDTSFVPTGTGFNGGVFDLEVQADGRIVAGGGFTSFNGASRNYIARLNADGSLDTSFAPGTGFNQASVQTLALEPGGRIVAGGNFTACNGTARNRIARLEATGALDASFNPGTGFDNNWVQALLPVSGGRVLAGGYFYNFNGTSRNKIARLGGDGSLDTTFNPGTGFDSWVHGLTPQTDERIVASGYFTTYNGTARSFLARLQTDGTLDPTFTAYDLTAAVPYGAAYTDDGRMLVVGARAARGATVQANLVMLKPDLSPVANIVAPPVTQSANPGDTVTFTVGAAGDGVLSYQWFKNGVALAGATGSSLVLTNVQQADVASYTVTVSNSLGSSTSSPVTLHGPHPAPTITQQPGVVTTTNGATVAFTVGATGTGTLTYQWRRFGVPIPGATGATLTLATVGRADAGPYDVVVADGLSLASSQPGWLRLPAGLLWGAGSSPALGIGATGRRDTPRVIADGVAQAVAGFDQTFFLKVDGTLWATGANYYGGLGDGATVLRSIPVQVASDVAKVAAGFGHTLILKRDGSLWAVGYNSSGQLGNNSATDSLTPVFVATGVAQISAGFQHSAFLKDDGSMWIFGDNGAGQLGDGTSTGRRVPVLVTSGVKQVVAGAFCTVFVRTDGSLYGMGEWIYNTPTLLDTGVVSAAAGSWYLLYTKTNGSLWYRNGVSNTNVSALLDTGVAAIASSGWGGTAGYLKTDGTMFAYGLNGSSAQPVGPGTAVASGVGSIASGSNHLLFTKPDHTLWSFGSYSVGQLGDGTSTVQSTPALVTDQVVATATGGNHVLSLTADGTLWGSGSNGSGQLGDGSTAFRSTPVPCCPGVAAVAAGGSHSLFIDTTGALWAMGLNGNGQLGDGTTTSRSLPVRVAEGVVAVAAGTSHSLFLKTDGSLWAMGYNINGQLGDGSTTSRSTPVQVASGVTALAAGDSYSLFRKADGTLWAMGENYSGQLGDGTTTIRSVPVLVASGVASLSAGSAHSLFRKTDGTLWATGTNTYGQFGDGTKISHTTPVQIATDVVAFAAGGYFNLFLKADGTLWAAGANASGQLGDGTTTDRSTPVQIGSGITGITAGGSVSLFVQAPGFGTGPMITAQPQSRLVAAGSTYVLSVAATGTGPVGYQWYKDGVALAGERLPTLAIAYATAADAGQYTLVATNSAGNVTSLPATLTISAAAAVSPAEQTVAPGATANFSVAATGTGTLRYQWFKDGVALAGQTGASLSLTNAQRGDVGYYRVAVTDNYSSTITADAALNLPSFPIADPVTDQLALGAASDGTNYLVAIQGDSANATATTAQLIAPDGALIGGRISVGRNGGEAGVGMGGVKAAFDGTNYLLVWADNAVPSTTRLYGVFVSRAGALIGAPFAFPVAGGASAYQRPQGIAFDGSRYLVVYSDGTDKPWKLCGRFVTAAGVVGGEMVFATNTVDSFQSVGANNGQFLVAWPARLGDSQYGVQGRLVSDAGVVSAVIAIDSDPSPSYNPLGVAGNGTDFLVAWNHDTGPGYPASTEWELRSRIVHANGTMSAAPVQLCSAATNPVIPVVAFDGSSFLVAWTQLTLGGTYPNVTSTPEDMSRAGGMDLAGRYLAGDGTPSGPVFNLVVGAGNQGLAPLAVGGGKCLVAYNALGGDYGSNGANAVRGLFLSAGVPPTIAAQPVSQNFAAGSTATFTVTAAGSDLTYQWSRDGVDIPGARGATLTVANVQPASFGNYTVTVSNATGSVTSAPALLGVVGVAGTRYRLLDYFRPLVVGNEWLYVGPGYDATQTHTRIRLESLDYPITAYTGRNTPQAYQESAVFFRSAYGYLTGATFNNTDTWNDYFFANGVSIGFLGYDDDPGTEEGRTDGPLVFSETMAVGESFVIAKDYYENGVWTGPMAFTIRLLGVESVTVPAGTFNNCLHIRYVTAGTPSDDLNDEWWAPGVGAVKHQDRDPGEPIYERNLVSFTVAQPVLPAITAQPAGVTIALGATTTLGVTANGTAPLSYQWYRGESGDTASPIVGATAASFTTPALTAWARYWVRVANRSSYADSVTALVEVTGGTMTVGDWAAQGGVPANQRGALATPAGDGVTNLMKFALGVPPLESATAHLPTATTYAQAGQPLAIALLFTQNPGAQGIDYVLEVSDNMVTWTEVARVIDVIGTNPDGTQLVRMREAVPPPAVRRFARLKVEVVP